MASVFYTQILARRHTGEGVMTPWRVSKTSPRETGEYHFYESTTHRKMHPAPCAL